MKRWRESQGFDVIQAARALGVTRHTYRKWELGTKPPGFDAWFKIHQATRGAVPWHAWASQGFAAQLYALVSSAAPPLPARPTESAQALAGVAV